MWFGRRDRETTGEDRSEWEGASSLVLTAAGAESLVVGDDYGDCPLGVESDVRHLAGTLPPHH